MYKENAKNLQVINVQDKLIDNDNAKYNVSFLSKKKVTTIYHISDIHIRRFDDDKKEYYQVFERLKNTLEEKKDTSSLIVITGDIIDFKEDISLDGYDQLVYFLQLISNIYPVVII